MKHLKLMIGLSLLVCSTSLYADTIFVDNKQIPVESELHNNTNYVPLRFVAEALGATVEWQKPYATIKKGDTTIQFKVYSYEVVVNGKQYVIPTKPFIFKNYTYVPLRFISEQLGCDVTYNTDKTIHITNAGKTPPVIPEYVDTRKYDLSSDKLWGVTHEENELIIVKNMTTGTTKEIFSAYDPYDDSIMIDCWINYLYDFKYSYAIEWVNNNLVIRTANQGQSKNLLLYSPTTDKLEVLVKDIYGSHINIPELDALLYVTDGAVDEAKTQYHIYHIQDRKSETITRENFYKILEKYAPKYLLPKYLNQFDEVSKSGLWSAFVDSSTSQDVIVLKDLSTYELKTIYKAPYNTCFVKWFNDNLIINSSNIMMLYNPKTDKLITISEDYVLPIYLEEPNAILYLEPNNKSSKYDYFIYYVDTNRSEQISREQNHKLQEKYLDRVDTSI